MMMDEIEGLIESVFLVYPYSLVSQTKDKAEWIDKKVARLIELWRFDHKQMTIPKGIQSSIR